jgi:hypothetical protein
MTTNTERDRPLILALRRNHNYGRNPGRSHIVRALTTTRRHPHIAPSIIDERAW